MFGKKDPRKKLEAQYRRLMEESRRLSTSDRKKSDEKIAEAEDVLKQLDAMRD
jgi:hypothetical protein